MALTTTPLPINPSIGVLLPRTWLPRCQRHLFDQVEADDTTSGSP
jgi:hypothetical protein